MDREINKLVFFDFETTGINTTKDRIVEFSFIKVDKNFKEIDCLDGLVNPLIPIPKEASDVHKIYDEDVVEAPSFLSWSEKIADFIEGCVLVGFRNGQFDNVILMAEFDRLLLVRPNIKGFIDVGVMYNRLNPRTLSAAFKQYIGEEMSDAHQAAADVEATIQVFEAMLNQHEDILKDVDLELYSTYDKKILDIQGWFEEIDGEPYFTRGKNAGKHVKEDQGYLDWMLNKAEPGTFLEDTLNIASKWLTRRR